MQIVVSKLSFLTKAVLLPSLAAFIITGCATAGGPTKANPVAGCAKEGVVALLENPNMEKQVNRAATATALLKVSNEMLYRMPVSADAKWIDEVTYENTPEQQKQIMEKLKEDPYFGTVLFTDMQTGNITTFLSRLSPAESHLYGLLEKLYKRYPEIYTLSMSPESFQKFNGGERKNVDAISSNQYENIEDAILSLVAVNIKKDLKAAIDDFNKATTAAANKKEDIATMEKDSESKKANAERIKVAEAELKEMEKTVDEKEKIMDQLWENAIATLDTNVDDKKMELVRKIQSVLSTVDDNAIFAGCTYTIALGKGYQSIGQLDNEMKILARTAAAATANPQINNLMQQRIKRLGGNAIMAIPNIAVGMYMIVKQQLFASKYNGVIKKLVKADDEKQKLLKEQQAAAQKAQAAQPVQPQTPPAAESAPAAIDAPATETPAAETQQTPESATTVKTKKAPEAKNTVKPKKVPVKTKG